MRKRQGEGCSFVAEQLQELADGENINSSHVSSWEIARMAVCTDSKGRKKRARTHGNLTEAVFGSGFECVRFLSPLTSAKV